MPRSRDEEQHEETRQMILKIARQQMSLHGTAGVGMRNIARELELAPSGLYRYFKNLDEIITALILDAFHTLGDAVEHASASLPETDYRGRLIAVLMAYREWALQHPTDFQLIHGNPIPGYKAPTELTLPAARQGFRAIVDVIKAAIQAGYLEVPIEYLHLPAGIEAHLRGVAMQEGDDGPLAALYLAAVGWARIHGFVMLEVFGSIQLLIGDPEALYRLEIDVMLKQFGLAP